MSNMVDIIEATVVGEEKIISEEEIEEVEETENKLEKVSEGATEITVETDEDYLRAVEKLREVKDLYDLVESLLEPMRASAYNHYKTILNHKKSVLSSGDEAIEALKSEIENYAEEKRQIEGDSKESKDEDSGKESVPEVEGAHYRETWSGEVTDMEDLCEAIANGEAPAHLVEPNKKEINKMARQFKKNLDNIPGLEANVDRTFIDRS